MFGIYGWLLDRKSMKNRVFYALCLSLCCWTLALSLASSAPDYDTALFWQRIAAIGRSSMYAFLLHFVLSLTGKYKILKKKWFYGLMYAPAVVLVIIFSLVDTTAQAQHNLIVTSFGWVKLYRNNFWEWFYNAYYSVYTLASIALIIRWRLRIDKNEKVAASLLVISFGLAFVMGSLTDVILIRLFAGSLPEMVPLAILIPIAIFYYSIKKHGLMKGASPKSSLWSEAGVKEQAVTIYHGQFLFKDEKDHSTYSNKLTVMIMSPLMFVFSIINLVYFTLLSLQDFSLILTNSLIVLGLAYCFTAVSFINDAKTKYRIMTMLIAFLLVFLHLAYYDYIGPAIWTASFVYIMLAMYQADKIMLTVFAATVCGLGIYTWIRNVHFTLSVTYYVAQFVLFAVAFLISWLVFNMNARKNTRIREQIKQLTLISQVSKSFLTISNLNYDEKVTMLLEQSGKHCEVELNA
jgi:MFS family permease